MKRLILHVSLLALVFVYSCNRTTYENGYISDSDHECSFALIEKGRLLTLCLYQDEFEGVGIALANLKEDLEKVSGLSYPEICEGFPSEGNIIIAGTAGRNAWIDDLISRGLIPGDELEGKWEKFILTTIDNPFPGINSALVIAGSDKRGTIFGIYDLAEKIGVSPWYFWADVPVVKRDRLYVKAGVYTDGEPGVKYRGIFINDEAPALAGWVHEKYGSFNHEFYEHVFELILRLKGNYLWPAMWGRAFYDDDTLNPVIADTYGVVIGTSHHEPLMRAHDEWRRYGEGPWNYDKNQPALYKFWREGVRRMGENESVITVGMRGDGDEPMTEGTAIELLERIVRDQRIIIEEETGKAAEDIPQCWALYKEVQDYYDKGMRVPEDITLLLCDDNWGNIRKLPKAVDAGREGGFGIYYHFDYVGGPRNYKWLNTNQIERTWEQMRLAWEYGARQLWIVNVGDIKPMELPISFFLDYAWDPEAIGADDLPAYYRQWAQQQFGTKHSTAIGDILSKYTKYNARRKPEMLSPETYSLENFREFERIVEEYKELVNKTGVISSLIGEPYRDAFFQLVEFPVKACANLNEMYYYTALNGKYAREGRSLTNDMADKVEELFAFDKELTRQYHEDLAGGKWNHMMSQTHIGYTYWQEPPENKVPAVSRIDVPQEAAIGISVEGSVYDTIQQIYVLPEFDCYNRQKYRISVYNRGLSELQYNLDPQAEWLRISGMSGKIEMEETLEIAVDWNKLKEEFNTADITIRGEGSTYTIRVFADNSAYLEGVGDKVFLESNGVVSVEAENYSNAVPGAEIRWERIPGLGRTASALTSVPVDAGIETPGNATPHLAYDVYLKDSGNVSVYFILMPTLDFHNSGGRFIAVSIDDGEPIVRNIHEGNASWLWNLWVGSNSIYSKTDFHISEPGKHTVKYWLVDPGLVVQKMILYRGTPVYSYLGPPQSFSR